MTDLTGTKRSTETATASPEQVEGTREVTLTRIIDAPRELVFEAWTDPKHMAQWWGPRYFTNPVCEMDVRPGGSMHIRMQGPGGDNYPMKGTFREVVKPELLVFSGIALEDRDGSTILETVTTVMFDEHDGKTKLTVHSAATPVGPSTEGPLAGMEEGWSQSLDKLTEYLEQR
ncbi:MAG: SRPBCC domain-containing protein [Chloroflexota bacterium]